MANKHRKKEYFYVPKVFKKEPSGSFLYSYDVVATSENLPILGQFIKYLSMRPYTKFSVQFKEKTIRDLLNSNSGPDFAKSWNASYTRVEFTKLKMFTINIRKPNPKTKSVEITFKSNEERFKTKIQDNVYKDLGAKFYAMDNKTYFKSWVVINEIKIQGGHEFTEQFAKKLIREINGKGKRYT